MSVFAGAGGMITLVHFSLVFPRPKFFIKGRPWLIHGLYLYFFGSMVLYFLKIAAFGTIAVQISLFQQTA